MQIGESTFLSSAIRQKKDFASSPFDESGSKMKMSVEYWCNFADRGKWKYSEENLYHYYSLQN
jgi:hypothetical protein